MFGFGLCSGRGHLLSGFRGGLPVPCCSDVPAIAQILMQKRGWKFVDSCFTVLSRLVLVGEPESCNP